MPTSSLPKKFHFDSVWSGWSIVELLASSPFRHALQLKSFTKDKPLIWKSISRKQIRCNIQEWFILCFITCLMYLNQLCPKIAIEIIHESEWKKIANISRNTLRVGGHNPKTRFSSTDTHFFYVYAIQSFPKYNGWDCFKVEQKKILRINGLDVVGGAMQQQRQAFFMWHEL